MYEFYALLESSQPTVCYDCTNQWEKICQTCENMEQSRRIIIRIFQLSGKIQYEHGCLMQQARRKENNKKKEKEKNAHVQKINKKKIVNCLKFQFK